MDHVCPDHVCPVCGSHELATGTERAECVDCASTFSLAFARSRMVPRFASCTGAEQLTIYLRKLGEEGLTPADFIVLRTGAVVVEPKVKKPNQKPQPIPVFGVIRYVFACPHGNDAMFCEDCEKGETVIPPKHGEVAH